MVKGAHTATMDLKTCFACLPCCSLRAQVFKLIKPQTRRHVRLSSNMRVGGAGDRGDVLGCRYTLQDPTDVSQDPHFAIDKRQLLLSLGAVAVSSTLDSFRGSERCDAAESGEVTRATSSDVGNSHSSSDIQAPSSPSSPRAYLDIVVDGEPYGRIVIAVDQDVAPIGAQRFLDLAYGKEGVSYRRSRITFLDNQYIQATGVRSLSYKASGRTSIAGGPDTESLESEMALAASSQSKSRHHDQAGIVSLVVQPAQEIETKDKLVAVKGQLLTVTEVLGELPNGSGFAITTGPAPQLDATNLIVGQVISGQDIVDRLALLPRVKNNSGSPFFQAGKAAGDKRAKVAERAFGKPFAKIVIEDCGLL